MYERKTKFLIVDDMNMFRQMVRQALGGLDFNVMQEAGDGAIALRMLEDAIEKKEPFDFIICDWNMPKMKGIDLLRKVRAASWGKNLPFLMLTAEAEKATVIEALKEGVDAYVIKPFTINQLALSIRSIHEKKHPAPKVS